MFVFGIFCKIRAISREVDVQEVVVFSSGVATKFLCCYDF